MSKAFWNLIAISSLAIGLAGCVGTAGVSTWEYRAGPGYEMQRAYDGAVHADPYRGFTSEACSTTTHRRTGPSGIAAGEDVIDCSVR